MLRIVDLELYAEGVRYHHYSFAPPASQSEVLAERKKAARAEHQRALAGDFNPDRGVYVDWLAFIADNHASRPEDMLAFLVEPELFFPVSADMG